MQIGNNVNQDFLFLLVPHFFKLIKVFSSNVPCGTFDIILSWSEQISNTLANDGTNFLSFEILENF